MTSGYSGTPLVRKLGIKAGMACAVVDPPEDYWDLLVDLPEDLTVTDSTTPGLDFIHLFVREQAILTDRLRVLRQQMVPDGMIWVSWPKKASKLQTDLSGGAVRTAGRAAGLVDVKVCAVDETWSGHKFVIPKEDRQPRER